MMSGFQRFPSYYDANGQRTLLADIQAILANAPYYQPRMPRSGHPLSVQMSNAGSLGWVSDKEGGYRYQELHPVTGNPWPPIPENLLSLWRKVANWSTPPEACLINYYAYKARMGSHVDRDEEELNAPVVSVSLGDDAIFHVGGHKRSDPKRKLTLKSGDVVVLGGEARLCYHGIDRILAGTSTLLSDGGRINLTLRRVTRSG